MTEGRNKMNKNVLVDRLFISHLEMVSATKYRAVNKIQLMLGITKDDFKRQ